MENPLLPHKKKLLAEGPNYVSKGVPINRDQRIWRLSTRNALEMRFLIKTKKGNNSETNIFHCFGKPMYSNRR